MLLVHQSGSLKIGEVLRYTLTYTPAHDRILPSPSTLHLKIKNTSAIALRAAFIHGPYTICVSAYPSHYNPLEEFKEPQTYGVPQFEPQLKAGGSFSSQLLVPEDVRATAGTAYPPLNDDDEAPKPKSVSWVIEVASQVIFSASAAVHFELMVARDEKSLSIGGVSFTAPSPGPASTPGQVRDLQLSQGAKEGYHAAQPRGVFSKAIRLTVEDTAALWNKPVFPQWDENAKARGQQKNADAPVEDVTQSAHVLPTKKRQQQKKIHLVVLTHGLHSNLGADMLFLKESIDAAARKAKQDARIRRAKEQEAKASKQTDDEDSDDEEVIVRGYSGNAVRTEKGIKYLGKRLAKYVLAMTYPDQPYHPVGKSGKRMSFRHDPRKEPPELLPSHRHSSIMRGRREAAHAAYKITSISFVAHSLGGLIQIYAVAYIQKHSPEFFNIIRPINFVALASPFLGLNNENPLYVKFALNFGLVGRTGQDLGLTWRAPSFAKNGWDAIVSTIGDNQRKPAEAEDPGAKPLLRILPTGPAHIALKKFRNRTVYSNVVNDGIVPLRTSCLLFLDWQGLGRVEKARREMGLVGTVAGWGWAELTGQNSGLPSQIPVAHLSHGGHSHGHGHGDEVPLPAPTATIDDDTRSLQTFQSGPPMPTFDSSSSGTKSPDQSSSPPLSGSPFASFLGLFKAGSSTSKPQHATKKSKIYVRSQTIPMRDTPGGNTNVRRKATSGESPHDDLDHLETPPRTTIFESAGDLLSPMLPSTDFILKPSARPTTIFHDRVYHPDDIPIPPMKRKSTRLLSRNSFSPHSPRSPTSPGLPSPGFSHQNSELSAQDYDDPALHARAQNEIVDGSAMKVEEKIARAYHRDLSWRKVLVRLEPDAHNNIIVRRMFPNAHGWPVVQHLVETHFSDSYEARTRDESESDGDRAGISSSSLDITNAPRVERPAAEGGDESDEVPEIMAPKPESLAKAHALEATSLLLGAGPQLAAQYNSSQRPRTRESAQWSDQDFADSIDDDTDDEEHKEPHQSQSNQPASPDQSTSSWTWTDVIAGKGATLRARSRSNESKRNSRETTLGMTASAARRFSGESTSRQSGSVAAQQDGEDHGEDVVRVEVQQESSQSETPVSNTSPDR